MNNKLKPCPFCGGEVRIVHNEPYTLGAIVCDTCKALVMFPWYKTESQLDLKEEWDKRADDKRENSLCWSKQGLYPDGFGGVRVGYACPYCKQYVPYAGKYCGKCGERVLGGDE